MDVILISLLFAMEDVGFFRFHEDYFDFDFDFDNLINLWFDGLLYYWRFLR